MTPPSKPISLNTRLLISMCATHALYSLGSIPFEYAQPKIERLTRTAIKLAEFNKSRKGETV